MATNYEIFLSCERKSEPVVVKLYKKLTQTFGLRIWTVAVNAATSDKPQPLIKKALNSSQIFIACMTHTYTESKDVIDEIVMANELGLPGICVLLEPMVPHNFPGLAFTQDWPQIKMYENPDELKKWIGTNYDELVDEIEQLLNRRFNRPGRELDELESIFHDMQCAFDKSYEKTWKKLDSYANKENESFSIELNPEGSMKIGAVKGTKFAAISNHIGNWSQLRSKLAKNLESYNKFESLMRFCFKYLGKTGAECLNKEFDGLFKVTQGNPVTIEFLKSQKTVTINAVLSQYFQFIANSTWQNLGYKARKVMISCAPEYGILEKGDLKTCLQNAGLDILQVVSIPMSEVVALNEKNLKKGKNGDQGLNKYALIDWNSGAISSTGYETNANAPVKLLSSFNDSSLTTQMFDKLNFDLIRSKLKNPNEVELTKELVEKTLLDAHGQFSYGSNYARIKVSKSNTIEITEKEMMALCNAYVEQSSLLLRAIMHEKKMKLTDFKRVYINCPLPYRDFAAAMYARAFDDYKLEPDFFCFEEIDGAIAAVATMADRKLRKNEKMLVTGLDFNFGLRDYAGVFDSVLKRGTSLPAEAKVSYTTIRDFQNALALKIYSGERPLARYCDYLGQLAIPNLPKKRAGEVTVEVTFTIDDSGILVVDAQESSQGTHLKTSIDRSNMKLQKNKSAILEAIEHEQSDTELVKKMHLATTLIAQLQVKYRNDEKMTRKIDDLVDTVVKHSDTMDAARCDRIIKEIKQYG